jgi:predicted aconitase
MISCLYLLLVSIYLLLNVSSIGMCDEPNTTRSTEGAVVGGVLGAVAGGAIGNKSHKTAEGALIGAALGALSGAVVGSNIKSKPAAAPQSGNSKPEVPDQGKADIDIKDTTAEKKVEAVSQSTPYASKVTMKQIIYWTEQGLPDEEIMDRIRNANAKFILTPDDIAYLKKQGVSQPIIDLMQQN